MPRSKRNKVVHLTATQKKPASEKNARLFTQIHACADTYPTVLVLTIANMRTSYLQELRAEVLPDSRLFLGKTKVMAKALGLTPAEEYSPGFAKLAPLLKGNSVGLLFTPRKPEEIKSVLEEFRREDYSRAGSIAPETFVVPEGIVHNEDGEMPHSMEVTVRNYGMPTKLVKGKVTLDQEYRVCKEGDILNSHQAALLKMFGRRGAEFKVAVEA
jgi:mRNA turnover protein 4